MVFWRDCYGYTMGALREIWMLISNANIIAVSISLVMLVLLFSVVEKKLSKKVSVLYITLCSVYATFLCTVTILGRLPNCTSSFNDLFLTYIKYLNGDLGAKYDILYNIFLFVPVGMLSIRYKSIGKNLLFLLLLPCAIETAQIITSRGVFEVTDVINNFVGGLIGYLFLLLFSVLIEKSKRYYRSRKGGQLERAE